MDAQSALERPFGMERVLRKRRAGGGERVMSGTGAGAVGGALNKESCSNGAPDSGTNGVTEMLW